MSKEKQIQFANLFAGLGLGLILGVHAVNIYPLIVVLGILFVVIGFIGKYYFSKKN